MPALRRPLAAAIFAALSLPAAATELACHIHYGGEDQVLTTGPVASPYRVPATAIGSYFLFRAVLQTEPADLASIKIYTYADREEGPALIHQASHPYPPPAAGRHGFSGLNFVYEPLRDGELQYWCELR